MTEKKHHVKELFSHTVIYGFGIVLNKSVNIILLPLYTKFFSAEELGLYTLVLAISFFLGIVYTYGMETSFLKFFIDSKNDHNKKQIYSTSLVYLFFSSLIFSTGLYFSSGFLSGLVNFQNEDYGSFLLKVLAVMLVADTLYRFPLLLFRANLDTKTYSLLNIFTFAVNLAFNFIFILYYKSGVEGIFYSYFISVFLTFLVSLFITRKYITYKISFLKFKELARYGNKFIYIGAALILIDQSDRFFLKYFYNEATVGIYFANYRLATVMSLAIAAFRFSWTPYFLNLSENPENKKIISSIFTYFVFSGISMFLLFSTLIKYLVKISFGGTFILSPEYWTGLTIVPFILLAYFFAGLYHNLHAVPFFKNKTIFILVITIFGLAVNLFLNFFLIQIFSINGAAVSTLVTYIVMFLWIYFYSQKIYKINYQWEKIIKISIPAFVILAVLTLFDLQPVLGIIISSISFLIFLLVLNTFRIIELKKVKILFRRVP